MIVRKSTFQDVQELAANMRLADVREIRSTTLNMDSIEQLVAFNVGASTAAFTALTDDGSVMAMGGVAPAGDGTGSVWLHGTDLMDSHRISLGRASPALVDLLHAHYSILTNWADTRNTAHINWLRWTGFRFLRTSKTFAHDGTPFVEFFRKGN